MLCCAVLCQVLSDARLELPVSSRPGLLPPDQLERFMSSWGQQLSSLTLLLLRWGHVGGGWMGGVGGVCWRGSKGGNVCQQRVSAWGRVLNSKMLRDCCQQCSEGGFVQKRRGRGRGAGSAGGGGERGGEGGRGDLVWREGKDSWCLERSCVCLAVGQWVAVRGMNESMMADKLRIMAMAMVPMASTL